MSSDTTHALEIEADGEKHVLLPSPTDRKLVISDLLRHAGLPLNTRCGPVAPLDSGRRWVM